MTPVTHWPLTFGRPYLISLDGGATWVSAFYVSTSPLCVGWIFEHEAESGRVEMHRVTRTDCIKDATP